MTDLKNLQSLISLNERRLAKLKEQQAIAGISVDPKVLLEIEDIEATLKELYEKYNAPTSPTLTSSQQISSSCILVVDDEPSWQDIIKRQLRELNCRVVTASNYQEAVQELNDTLFDLVTMDLNLDESVDYAHGLELCSKIRETYGDSFPIIVISGKGNLSRQRKAFKAYDVVDFFEKSDFNAEEFKATVQQAINHTG